MKKISSSTILQINATMIAGLLIFVSIDYISFSNISDLAVDSINDVYLKQIDHVVLNATISQLKTDLQNIPKNEKERFMHMESQIDDLMLKYYVATEKMHLFEKRSKALSDADSIMNNAQRPIAMKSFMITMTSMFAISSMIQLFFNTSESHRLSRIITGSAFGSVIGGLPVVILSI